jgi:hypothetical protein
MFQAMRKHLTPSTLIAFLALVFAITGGAFAASSHTAGAGSRASASTALASTSKAKPKAKAGPRGPAGPKGATGATGATGPAGATGPGGAQGAQGPAGAAGAKGETGVAGPQGPAGAKGTTGPAGPEGTFGGQALPSGKTLSGQWAASGYGEAGGFSPGSGHVATGVTYALPVELEEGEGAGNYIKAPTEEENEKGEFPTPPPGCTGNYKRPGAAPGNLCVFVGSEVNIFSSFTPLEGDPSDGSVQTGFEIQALTAAKGSADLSGSWAVTAK